MDGGNGENAGAIFAERRDAEKSKHISYIVIPAKAGIQAPLKDRSLESLTISLGLM
jgi:hypothetical protein